MKLYLAGEYYRNMANAVKQIVWGGIVPDVRNESIFSRCDDGRQLAEVSRSLYSECGGTGSIDDTVLGKPSHSAKIQGGAGTGVLAVRGRLRR